MSMAFLARIDFDTADELSFELPRELAAPAPAAVPVARFSDLEWSVIRLAKVDHLWTIRGSGTLRRMWNALLGRNNPQLANERLEALRQMAVLSWHYGFTVPGEDVASFLAAGFTADQYELLVNSIRSAVRTDTIRTSTEAFA
jgi:hypothetical protein